MSMKNSIFQILILALCILALAPATASAATTSVHIVKYTPDGTSVINETTVDYQWMETHLPVLGDGVTHYYHQGPTFNRSDLWDQAEYQNVETRDMGAVKGTPIRDLCDLVGGMEAGDTLRVLAADGFYKNFSYQTVYGTDPEKVSMGLTWYVGEDAATGDPQGEGYVPDYYDGMRLIFFADNSTNPWGWHVFGDTDMKETMPEDEWHLFGGEWPSSSGLSVKQVSDLEIYTGGDEQEGAAAPETPTTQAPLSIAAVFAALALGVALRR